MLQSHRLPLPWSWLDDCLASVRDWAAANGFLYRFLDDALFAVLPADIRDKTRGQPVVASDLARLLVIRKALEDGHEAVVWLDADTLVIDPGSLRLPDESYAMGREVWVQRHGGGYRAYVKVHNAFLLFRAGNPLLDFYVHAAERILRRHRGDMAPQLIGPKLLTALHNMMSFPVSEAAAMLSPAVMDDLVAGDGPALALFRSRSAMAPAAVNLCGSLVADGSLDTGVVSEVIRRLLADPGVLAPCAVPSAAS